MRQSCFRARRKKINKFYGHSLPKVDFRSSSLGVLKKKKKKKKSPKIFSLHDALLPNKVFELGEKRKEGQRVDGISSAQ